MLTKNTAISANEIPANTAEPGPSPRFVKNAWPKSLQTPQMIRNTREESEVTSADVRKDRRNRRSKKIVPRQHRRSMVRVRHGDIHQDALEGEENPG